MGFTGTETKYLIDEGTALIFNGNYVEKQLTKTDNYWYMACREYDGGYGQNIIKLYKSSDGTSWTDLNYTHGGNNISEVFIEAKENIIHIAAVCIPAYEIIYNIYVEDTAFGVEQTADTISSYTYFYKDFCIDSSNNPHIFYSIDGGSIEHVYLSSGSFTSETVVSNYLLFSAAIDYTDNIHLAALNFSTMDSEYMIGSTGSWSTPEVVNNHSNIAAEIQVMGTVPYIAFSVIGSQYEVYYKPSTWQASLTGLTGDERYISFTINSGNLYLFTYDSSSGGGIYYYEKIGSSGWDGSTLIVPDASGSGYAEYFKFPSAYSFENEIGLVYISSYVTASPTVYKTYFESINNSTDTYEEPYVVQLNSTRYLRLFYYNNTNYRLELRDETMSLLDSYDFSINYIKGKRDIVKLTSSTAAVLFTTTTIAQGYLIIITADTISLSTVCNYASSEIDNITIDYLDGNSIIAAYTESNTAYALVFTYSISTLTTNLAYKKVINGSNITGSMKVKRITDTTALVMMNDNSTQEVKGLILSISTNTITANDFYYINNTNANMIDMDILSTGYVGVVLSKSSYSTLNYYILQISDTAITERDSGSITTNSMVAKINLAQSGLFVIGYSANYNTYYQLISFDETYKMLEEDLIETGNYGYINFCDFNSILVTYQDTSTTLNYKTLSGFTASSTTEYKEASWVDNSTLFLANFENNLNAGNLAGEISNIRIKRIADDGSFYNTLIDLDASETEYIDTTARNNIEYTYLLTTLDANGNEGLGVTTAGELDFWGWFLTDGTNIYKFDAELDSGSIVTNRAISVQDGYTQYPIVSFGNRNYRTATIKTIPYTYNETSGYSFTYSLLEELRTFINNEEEKYLKNTKGEIFKVITSNFNYSYNDDLAEQPFEINFDWIEVGVGEVGVS